MNKKEIKNLLKRRESLLEVHGELRCDSNDKNNSSDLNSIYNSGANDTNSILKNFDDYLSMRVKETPVGVWLLKIKGITPDLAAGLLAYFDIDGKDCAMQFIKYSGADNCNNPHNNNVRDIMRKIKTNFKNEPDSLYNKIYEDELMKLSDYYDLDQYTIDIRAERRMIKIFISHLFEEMYREAHNGKLPERHNNADCIIIDPEVPYTK